MYYVVRAERKNVARHGLQGVKSIEICHVKLHSFAFNRNFPK